jgi:hypothetical protein
LKIKGRRCGKEREIEGACSRCMHEIQLWNLHIKKSFKTLKEK